MRVFDIRNRRELFGITRAEVDMWQEIFQVVDIQQRVKVVRRAQDFFAEYPDMRGTIPPYVVVALSMRGIHRARLRAIHKI